MGVLFSYRGVLLKLVAVVRMLNVNPLAKIWFIRACAFRLVNRQTMPTTADLSPPLLRYLSPINIEDSAPLFDITLCSYNLISFSSIGIQHPSLS